MTQRGEHAADQIRDELKCPSCAYSLRGLPGDQITCPECGLAINVAQLTAAKWRGPWYRAPVLNTLALPVAWALFAPVVSMIPVFMASHRNNTAPMWLILFSFVVVVLGWIGLLALAVRRFGSAEAVWLSLLLHAVFVIYALGIIGTVSMIISVLINLPTATLAAIFNGLGVVVCVAVIVAARLLDRFVAYRCIRRYLRSRAGGGTMPT